MRKDFEIFLTHTLTENERRNVLLEINGGNSVDKKQIDLVYTPSSMKIGELRHRIFSFIKAGHRDIAMSPP